LAHPLATNAYTSASLKAMNTVTGHTSANGTVKIANHPAYRVCVNGTTVTVEVLLPDITTGALSWATGAQYTN
jgi:hypothetical protein